MGTHKCLGEKYNQHKLNASNSGLWSIFDSQLGHKQKSMLKLRQNWLRDHKDISKSATAILSSSVPQAEKDPSPSAW